MSEVAVSRDGRSLVHAGLARTASTALSRHFFPNLGLPYSDAADKFDGWYKAIRYAPDFVAPPPEHRQIISGVNLATPGKIPSHEVARRLHQTFNNAVLLLVVRDPYEHFVSYYREGISIELTKIAMQAEVSKAQNEPLPAAVPYFHDINTYFDRALAGSGPYFHVMQLDRILGAFETYFPTLVVDFSLITNNFGRFSDIVCGELGIPAPVRTLPRENRADLNALSDRLAQIPAELVSAEARAHLTHIYRNAELSEHRRNLLDKFIMAKCTATFARAIRG